MVKQRKEIDHFMSSFWRQALGNLSKRNANEPNILLEFKYQCL